MTSSPDSANPTEARTFRRSQVAALLALFPGARVTELMLDQWADDLEQVHPGWVKAACDHWRRTELKRPMPAQLIEMCRKLRQAARGEPARPEVPEAPRGRPRRVEDAPEAVWRRHIEFRDSVLARRGRWDECTDTTVGYIRGTYTDSRFFAEATAAGGRTGDPPEIAGDWGGPKPIGLAARRASRNFADTDMELS